jgi:hypothetical protein
MRLRLLDSCRRHELTPYAHLQKEGVSYFGFPPPWSISVEPITKLIAIDGMLSKAPSMAPATVPE